MNNLFGRVIKKKKKKVIVIIKKKTFLKKYKKNVFYYSKIFVYDIYNECNLGDLILIRKTRPLSKKTFWILSKIIEKIRLL